MEDQLELSILLCKVIFFNRAVEAIYSFRDYMEQIIFDSSCLSKWTTFLKDLSYAFDHFKPFIPWSGISFFVFYSSHPFFKVYCVIFICCATCCHSLSFIVTCCHSLYHSLSLIAIRCTTHCHSLYHLLSFSVTLCHSLSIIVPLVFTQCTTGLSFYKQSIFEIILQEQEIS